MIKSRSGTHPNKISLRNSVSRPPFPLKRQTICLHVPFVTNSLKQRTVEESVPLPARNPLSGEASVTINLTARTKASLRSAKGLSLSIRVGLRHMAALRLKLAPGNQAKPFFRHSVELAGSQNKHIPGIFLRNGRKSTRKDP